MLEKDSFYNFDLIFDNRYYIFWGECPYMFGEDDILLEEIEGLKNKKYIAHIYYNPKDNNEKIFKFIKNIKYFNKGIYYGE